MARYTYKGLGDCNEPVEVMQIDSDTSPLQVTEFSSCPASKEGDKIKVELTQWGGLTIELRPGEFLVRHDNVWGAEFIPTPAAALELYFEKEATNGKE